MSPDSVSYTHLDVYKRQDIHTYYDTKIQIWTKEVVDAVVESVRRTDSEEGVYHYGAVFIGMTDTDAVSYTHLRFFNTE